MSLALLGLPALPALSGGGEAVAEGPRLALAAAEELAKVEGGAVVEHQRPPAQPPPLHHMSETASPSKTRLLRAPSGKLAASWWY